MARFNPFDMLMRVVTAISTANRYALLFSMSERELAMRGLDRDRLARGYIQGLGAN